MVDEPNAAGAAEGWLARLWARSGADSATRAHTALLAATLGLGALVRTLGYFGDLPFWCDEADWARRILWKHWGTATSRPIGYLWVSHFLARFEDSERSLRSLSFAAGIASLPAFYFLARRLTISRWFALFGLFLLALHPVAVSMSKEFKPYELELFLHIAFVLLGVTYAQTGKSSLLVGSCALALVSTPLSWSVVFVFPVLFVTMGARTLRDRKYGALAGVAATALTALAGLVAIYMTRLSHMKDNSEYWGDKYDVFFTGTGTAGRLVWLWDKTGDLASFPMELRVLWGFQGPERLLSFTQAALVAIGVVALVARRRFGDLLWLLSPWAVAVAFNVAGKWPYGVFRTNLFLLAYASVLGLIGLDWISSARFFAARRVTHAYCAVASLVFAPVDLSVFTTKDLGTMAFTSSMPTAMEIVYRQSSTREPGKRRLLLDRHACKLYRYYRDDHYVHSVRYRDFFRQGFDAKCATVSWPDMRRLLRRNRGREYWVITAKVDFGPRVKEMIRESCVVHHEHDLPSGTYVAQCIPKH